MFIVGNVMLFIQVVTNEYFRGCILTKVERREVGTGWYGVPYNNIFDLTGITPKTEKVNVMYGVITWILIITSVSKTALYYYKQHIQNMSSHNKVVGKMPPIPTM